MPASARREPSHDQVREVARMAVRAIFFQRSIRNCGFGTILRELLGRCKPVKSFQRVLRLCKM